MTLLNSSVKTRDVERIAQLTLERIAEQGAPLTPVSYEIWFTYMAESDLRVKAAIDEALARENPLSPETISRLHEEFFSLRQVERSVDEIGDQMMAQLQDLVERIDDDDVRGRAFVNALTSITEKVGATNDPGALRDLAEQLVSINETQLEEKRKLAKALALVRDQVADLRMQLTDVKHDAFTDELTTLCNRRHFDLTLEDMIAAARKRQDGLVFAFADIDGLSAVNDKWGKAAGDKILQRFADLLRRNIRGLDTVGRYGGEEFAMILPNSSLTAGHHVADRIREYFSTMRFVARDSGERLGRMTVSFGVTALRDDDDAVSLIGRADRLLTTAKEKGRNTVESGE